MRLLSYNIARREAPWQTIMESGADVAMLQEISEPPEAIAKQVRIHKKNRGMRKPRPTVLCGSAPW